MKLSIIGKMVTNVRWEGPHTQHRSQHVERSLVVAAHASACITNGSVRGSSPGPAAAPGPAPPEAWGL